MSFRSAARPFVTYVLIAALMPTSGLAALRAPARAGDDAAGAERLSATRELLEAMNALPQAVASGRPQIYLVYAVDVAVPAMGPPAAITVPPGWFDEFLNELLAATPVSAPVRAPRPPVPPKIEPPTPCHVRCPPVSAPVREPRPPVPPKADPPTPCHVRCPPVAQQESILDEIEAADAQIRSLPSATGLAAVPDSLPFEANPNESVPVERSMSIAMKDALQEAGFDNPDNNGSATFTRGSGKVVYEGQFEDGDIIVTGNLVDGRIVLTKDFRPLTTSGEPGEPVRIRSTGQAPAAGGTPAAPVGQAAGPGTDVQTAQTPAPAELPPGARGVPAEVSREWGQELYGQFANEAKTIGGPRDAQGRLLDPNGQVVAPTTAAGLKMVQDAVVSDLETFTGHLRELQALPREHKIALGQDLQDASAALRTAAADMERAKANFEAFRPSEHLFNNSMALAAQRERAGDAAGAAELRAQAAATPYGQYVAARARYVELLNATPLLGVQHDGTFLYEAFADPGQFPARSQSAIANSQRYVDLLNRYLAAGITQTTAQAKELAGYNTIEQLAVFASPAYAYVHDRLVSMGAMIGSTVTADLIAELRAAANGSLKSWSDAAWQRIVDRSLVVLQIGCMFLPGGQILALGLAGVQVLRAGKDTVVAHFDNQDAIARASAAGFDRVVQTEEQAGEAAQNLFWTAGLSVFDVYGAVQYARLMKVLRSEQAAARAAQDAVEAGTARAGAAAAPAPGSAPSSTRPAATTPDGTWDPSVRAPQTEAEIEALFKQHVVGEARADAAQEVATEIKLARDAGVDERTIRDLTAHADSPLGNRMAAEALMKARLTAQGYDLTMTREEFTRLQGMSVRAGANGSGLTPDDIAWLNAHAGPGYFESLPRRGQVTGWAQSPFAGGGSGMPQEGFVAALDPDSAARLQAAWQARGGQYSGIPNADDVGTQILRPGTAGTPTVRIDPNATVLMPPPTGTPTVRLDPNSTVLIDPDATVGLADEVTQLMMSAQRQGGAPQPLARTIRWALEQRGLSPAS
ncbi:MAG TPA: hypothetical protein VFZ36_10025, partial [Vicinamibacterales bacterium]